MTGASYRPVSPPKEDGRAAHRVVVTIERDFGTVHGSYANRAEAKRVAALFPCTGAVARIAVEHDGAAR